MKATRTAPKHSSFILHPSSFILYLLPLWFARGVSAAETGLTMEDQASVEFWLAIIGGLLFGLIVALLALAVAIRYLAKHSTQPCRWCMEFIPKKTTVCPRCGKSLVKQLADARGSEKEAKTSPPQIHA